MRARLTFTGETVINFDDEGRRYIRVKRFEWGGAADDSALLASLIGHTDYRETDSGHDGVQSVHGPYDMSAISPDVFEPVTHANVIGLIEEFETVYERHGYDAPPLADTVRSQIHTAVIDPLSRTRCYRLREQPDAVVVGGVFLDFQEFVGIDPSVRAAFLVVCGAEL